MAIGYEIKGVDLQTKYSDIYYTANPTDTKNDSYSPNYTITRDGTEYSIGFKTMWGKYASLNIFQTVQNELNTYYTGFNNGEKYPYPKSYLPALNKTVTNSNSDFWKGGSAYFYFYQRVFYDHNGRALHTIPSSYDVAVMAICAGGGGGGATSQGKTNWFYCAGGGGAGATAAFVFKTNSTKTIHFFLPLGGHGASSTNDNGGTGYNAGAAQIWVNNNHTYEMNPNDGDSVIKIGGGKGGTKTDGDNTGSGGEGGRIDTSKWTDDYDCIVLTDTSLGASGAAGYKNQIIQTKSRPASFSLKVNNGSPTTMSDRDHSGTWSAGHGGSSSFCGGGVNTVTDSTETHSYDPMAVGGGGGYGAFRYNWDTKHRAGGNGATGMLVVYYTR